MCPHFWPVRITDINNPDYVVELFYNVFFSLLACITPSFSSSAWQYVQGSSVHGVHMHSCQCGRRSDISTTSHQWPSPYPPCLQNPPLFSTRSSTSCSNPISATSSGRTCAPCTGFAFTTSCVFHAAATGHRWPSVCDTGANLFLSLR